MYFLLVRIKIKHMELNIIRRQELVDVGMVNAPSLPKGSSVVSLMGSPTTPLVSGPPDVSPSTSQINPNTIQLREILKGVVLIGGSWATHDE